MFDLDSILACRREYRALKTMYWFLYGDEDRAETYAFIPAPWFFRKLYGKGFRLSCSTVRTYVDSNGVVRIIPADWYR